MEPSVKKFKKSVSRRKLVLLGLKNHQKKVSIANRWGKHSTAHQSLLSGIASRRILKIRNSASNWTFELFNPLKITAIITLIWTRDGFELLIHSYKKLSAIFYILPRNYHVNQWPSCQFYSGNLELKVNSYFWKFQ